MPTGMGQRKPIFWHILRTENKLQQVHTGLIPDLYWVRLSPPIQCPDFFLKIFSLKMGKNFQKFALKNARMPPMSRTDPDR